jgi:preprotein translocase subunit SecA
MTVIKGRKTMFKKFTHLLKGDPYRKKIDEFLVTIDQINALEAQFEKLSDAQLKDKTTEYRQRLKKGETLDKLLPETFATVREASKRVLGQRHYDVQLICGINLHHGAISELRTGEGKTLSATLPLYLNALEGKGAHLITVNDYLARRDGRWMGAIYHFLGLSVGVLQSITAVEGSPRAYIYDPNERSLNEDQNFLRQTSRQQAYLADITYGTNSEFGFDYLRDNIAMQWTHRVQRGHNYAIIDEVDNILIDEARTPLIISGPASEDSENYIRMAQIVKALNPEDYEVGEKENMISLTEVGLAHVEDMLGLELSDPERPEDVTPEQARLLGFLEQALRAQYLFHRNKEYIVQAGEVVIVDEFTGRMMPGRRWSDGLHQAVEAKEGVKVQAENITHATITIQNYFRMYKKLAGMTGTAVTEKEEFYRIYGLDVLAIPSNLEYKAQRGDSGLKAEETKDQEGYKYTYYFEDSDSSQTPLFYKRKDYPDVIYRTTEGKIRAMVMEIIRYHVIGRPQLVGTTSVESSERLSERLASELVRRLLQVSLIKNAWLKAKGAKVEDYLDAPELAALNEPLDQLRMAELRRLGRDYGLTSMDLTDESNRAALLESLYLEDKDWSRLQPLFDGGVPHQVLNARKHTEESLIIAGAGAFGAVTIATNMAGRGVDIKLGGELNEALLSKVNRVLAKYSQEDPYNMTMPERLEAVKNLQVDLEEEEEQTALDTFVRYMEDMAKVRELGGLHVIGSERHEARRIDNQLRGRAGRQGDPGSSRFYLSLEDDLMRMFGGEQLESMLSRFKIDENMPIEMNMINKLVEQAQTRVEGSNFDVRKHLLEYDDVLNTQRKRIYQERDKIFTKEDLHDDVSEMLQTELRNRVETGLTDTEGPWKLLAFLEEIQPSINTNFGNYPSFTFQTVMDKLADADSAETLKNSILKLAKQTVEVENEHIQAGAVELFDHQEQNLKTQIASSEDTLDAYLESLDPEEKHDYQSELSAILGSTVKLGPKEIQTLQEDPRSLKKPLTEILHSSLTLNVARRLLMTLERRFGEKWSLKPADLANLPFSELRAQLSEQISSSLSRRTERLFGENPEVARDLDSNQGLLEEALEDDDALLKLLQLTTQGKHIGFDERTHKREMRTHSRLNYVFVIADEIGRQSAEVLSNRILEHLHNAEQKLAEIFGAHEWSQLLLNELKLSGLPEKTRSALNAELGDSVWQKVVDQSIPDIEDELAERIQNVMGNQTQNRIYRDLLLRTITESWVEYLTKMEALRVSISMESYAQRDPLVQYKRQASTMFSDLLSEVRQGVISYMFRYRPVKPAEAEGETTQNKANASISKKKKRKRH